MISELIPQLINLPIEDHQTFDDMHDVFLALSSESKKAMLCALIQKIDMNNPVVGGLLPMVWHNLRATVKKRKCHLKLLK